MADSQRNRGNHESHLWFYQDWWLEHPVADQQLKDYQAFARVFPFSAEAQVPSAYHVAPKMPHADETIAGVRFV